jgi:hypothetical protein
MMNIFDQKDWKGEEKIDDDASSKHYLWQDSAPSLALPSTNYSV